MATFVTHTYKSCLIAATTLLLCVLTMQLASAQTAATVTDFDHSFADSTLRIDLLHTGNRHHEQLTLKSYTLLSYGWTGRRTPLPPTNSGYYRAIMTDNKGQILYAHNYSTLFREYSYTPQGLDSTATFEEVLLLPFPRQDVTIILQYRDSLNNFVTTSSYLFSPSKSKLHAAPKAPTPIAIQHSGDPHSKIDIAIVTEGYGRADSLKLLRDLDTFASYLFKQEPFKSHRQDFNVWGVALTADSSGITDPTQNRYINSALGATYNVFGSDRYLMTFNLFKLHDALANTPADHIIIMAGSSTYGGGAIFNFYAVSAVQAMSQWILPHELGHSIGGLADEYVDLDLSYASMNSTLREPVEPNITALIDFESKWKALLPEGTAVPTPENKLLDRRDPGPIGLFEGAGYAEKGIYRPAQQCMMKNYARFCPVCTEVLEKIFKSYCQ